jgi:hypothetical protein
MNALVHYAKLTKRQTRTICCVVATDTENHSYIPPLSVRSNLHIHEQPLLAYQFFALAELIERCQTETDPAQIFGQVEGGLIGVAVNAQNETVTGEVINFTEFEEGHETMKRQ